ncbi:division/cell wall cluster transcriptional repressor MraZ [Candidatus Kapabacteria bacterium]|nr:division/cell wall cluster transcriptional repressor MraZ [Candidatus Kapabacteria bacterium]
MAFFKGQELYSIDVKGRVNIPAKMRKSISEEANDTFVFTRGTDSCVIAYPLDQWKKHEDKFSVLNQYDEKNRFFLRQLLMWSEEVGIDRQQRVSMPKKLQEFAEIDGKVMIVGMIDHIEFWNPTKFEKYLESHDEPYEAVAEKVMSL